MKKLLLIPITSGVGLVALILVTYLVMFSGPPAEASRLVVQGGDLYRASGVLGSHKITNDKNIVILFGDEQNNLILTGKSVSRQSGSAHDPAGSRLYISRTDGADELAITSTDNVRGAFFDKSGENVLYFTKEGEIYRYNIASKQNTRLVKEASFPTPSGGAANLIYTKAPSGWMPGQYFEGSPGFATLDTATGEEKIIPNTTPQASLGGYSPIWTPDRNHIIFFNNLGLALINAHGTGFTQLTQSGDGTGAYGISDDPLWSSDGRYFVYHADYRIFVVELDIPNRRVVSAGAIAYGVEPRWVTEGKTISVLSPEARAGAVAVSVVDLQGAIVSGDKGSQGALRLQIPQEYRRPLTGRVAPSQVTVAPSSPSQGNNVTGESSPELRRENTPQPVPLNVRENREMRKEVPASAFNLVHQ